MGKRCGVLKEYAIVVISSDKKMRQFIEKVCIIFAIAVKCELLVNGYVGAEAARALPWRPAS